MKVLVVTQRFYPAIGGAENHVLNLSKELLKLGHFIKIFTTNWQTQKAPQKDSVEGMEVQRFPVTRFNFGVYNIMPTLFSSVLKENPDLIHVYTYGFFHADAAILASKLKRIPLVFTTLKIPRQPRTLVKRIVYNLYDRTIGSWGLRTADRIIATSNNEKEHLIKEFGLNSERITVIPTTVNHDEFVRLSDPLLFKSKYKIDGTIVLYVGRIAGDKGLDILIRAARSVRIKYPDVKFVIVGPDMGFLNQLHKLIENQHLQGSIMVTGPLYGEALLQAYSAASMLVLPSSQEVMPLVLLEANAAGLPVIATSIGGVPEIIKHNSNGLLVDYGNVEQLADSILLLLKDRKLGESLGRKGRNMIKNLSWKDLAKETERVYTSATQRSRNE
ncbi:MAG: glycosyltransferase family 4 protein [Candidatus Hodarchaeota archaeon]